MHTPDITSPRSGTLSRDLAASLVVFLVALPLSLGIALASGAPLMAGLIAAIIGGIVVGTAGGAPLQVSGPAAGLTVIVAGYIQQYGWGATCAITLGAGLLQLALGAAGVAPLALAISPAVIHGMLAAIGILIALSQAHVMLGHDPAGKGIKNLLKLPETIAHLDPAALIVGGATLAVLLLWPKLPSVRLKQVPVALAAVLAGTLVALLARLDVARVELGGSLLHALRLPDLPQEPVLGIAVAVAGLAFVASAESLLSAVATDKLHAGPRANLNRELMGQGLANTLSGLIGGLPVTGVIVRSTANITAGARTRLSAILHGVWMLLFVAALPGVITQIPLAALAALLVYTGCRLVSAHHIRELHEHGELAVYLVTLVAVVGTNLLEGLAFGFGVALLRLVWRLTHLHVSVRQHGPRWSVAVDGALTFAGVPKLATRLAEIPEDAEVDVHLALTYLDHAGYEALRSWGEARERMGAAVRMDDLEEAWARSRHPARESQRVASERREREAAVAGR